MIKILGKNERLWGPPQLHAMGARALHVGWRNPGTRDFWLNDAAHAMVVAPCSDKVDLFSVASITS